jgi:hypothetical protein
MHYKMVHFREVQYKEIPFEDPQNTQGLENTPPRISRRPYLITVILSFTNVVLLGMTIFLCLRVNMLQRLPQTIPFEKGYDTDWGVLSLSSPFLTHPFWNLGANGDK